MARVWVGSAVSERMGTRFPYGTFVINITACVLIGFSLEFLGEHVELNPSWRYLIPTGFIGAYSTFSTVSMNSILIGRRSEISTKFAEWRW